MKFKQDRSSYNCIKQRGLDKYNNKNEMSSEKGTYPLDEDSSSRQYREEIDSYLPQQGFIPKTWRRRRTLSSTSYQT